ncbi:MAG: hypothetical protein ABI461_21570, partial [Polyangiaceae bacterium]
MDSLLWLSTGAAVVYLLLGSLALVLRLGRPQETEHGYGMAVSFGMASFAIARSFAIIWPSTCEPMGRAMTVCAIAALVAAGHYVVILTRPKSATHWLRVIDGVGALYSIAAIVGLLRMVSPRGAVAPDGLGVFGHPKAALG